MKTSTRNRFSSTSVLLKKNFVARCFCLVCCAFVKRRSSGCQQYRSCILPDKLTTHTRSVTNKPRPILTAVNQRPTSGVESRLCLIYSHCADSVGVVFNDRSLQFLATFSSAFSCAASTNKLTGRIRRRCPSSDLRIGRIGKQMWTQKRRSNACRIQPHHNVCRHANEQYIAATRSGARRRNHSRVPSALRCRVRL